MILLALLAGMLLTSPAARADGFTRYVDTRIGTAPSPTALEGFPSERVGNTQPSAVVPFGMIQWGPDTDRALILPLSRAGSYIYQDSHIVGFSLTHLSGPGCSNSLEASILPYVGSSLPAAFSHENEQALAGYYAVKLDNGIQVELTSTRRSGLGRFTYPAGSDPNIRINFVHTGTGNHLGELRQIDSRHLSGWTESGDFCWDRNRYRIYYVIELENPIKSFHSFLGTAEIKLDARFGPSFLVKTGISYVSEQGAALNLKSENPDWDFDSLRATANQQWENALARIKVTGGSPQDLRTFYTALYHSLLHPNVTSDVDGAYMGFDQSVHNVHEFPTQTNQYANFSGWDIYRSQIQLLALLSPTETSDIAQSLVNAGNQCGALPRWANNNSDTGIMVGDPGSIIVSNAYAFGARNFDQSKALELMARSGLVPKTRCNGHESGPVLSNISNWATSLTTSICHTSSTPSTRQPR